MQKLIFKNKVLLSFFLVSFLLALIWTNGGKIIAGGEEGILFRHFSKFPEISVWSETGTGYPMPILLPRATFVSSLNFLDKFLLPQYSQLLIFFLLILSGLLGFYLLTREILGNLKVAVFAGTFFLLNLYTQSQVFGRFLFEGMFAWAYLPIFLFSWIKFAKTNKLKWLLVFIISSLIFSCTFGHPAYVITLWFAAILFAISEFWINRRNGKEILRMGSRFIICFVLWIGVNLWWIYPYFRLGHSSFSKISSFQANFDSLLGVSKFFPIWEILLLRQSFLFGKDSNWYIFYSSFWIYLISIIILFIVYIGWRSVRHTRYGLYLTLLAIFGLFISKGANFPFGNIFFKWLFMNFSVTEVLRNSYEKFGLVWLLPYSIFFASGLFWVSAYIKGAMGKMLVGMSMIIFCGVLVWPMWTGDIFTQKMRIEIPPYYEETNAFLNNKLNDGRVLILPIIPGDGVHYTWGYWGIEPSEFLFDKPVISRILRTEYFDDKYINLHNTFIDNGNYNELLNQMNIKYFILHRDLDTKSSSASSSTQVQEILKKNPEVSFLREIGQLSIYQYNSNQQQGLFILDGESVPEFTYKKLSATQYRINIKNASVPYIIIFKETFNKLWEASIDGQKITDHFLAFDYANGWIVMTSGNYEIKVYLKVLPWD